jgi:hypothetical protein
LAICESEGYYLALLAPQVDLIEVSRFSRILNRPIGGGDLFDESHLDIVDRVEVVRVLSDQS